MTITLVSNSTLDGLQHTQWEFWVHLDSGANMKVHVELDSYVTMARPTKRHKFQVMTHWFRLGHRRDPGVTLDAPPPVTIELRRRVMSRIADSIVFDEAKSRCEP